MDRKTEIQLALKAGYKTVEKFGIVYLYDPDGKQLAYGSDPLHHQYQTRAERLLKDYLPRFSEDIRSALYLILKLAPDQKVTLSVGYSSVDQVVGGEIIMSKHPARFEIGDIEVVGDKEAEVAMLCLKNWIDAQDGIIP